MDLYHVDIKMPAGFTKPTGRVSLEWSRHANQARFNDRYGEIPSFATATLDNLRIIEIGVEDGRVAKILYRAAIDAQRDLCMVLIPRVRAPWLVKTVWINTADDLHRTLDRSKYVC